jgi:hypothetical protein
MRLAALLILAPSLAFAQVGGAASTISGYDRIPPEFDRPYSGHLFERAAPLSEIDALCRKLSVRGGDRSTVLGCSVKFTYQGEPACGIMYYTGGRSTRRHEIAHCNGWEHP